ncbi:MAG TPA: universal stress protein, partial [Mycobacteriales bacterium]
MTYEDAVVVAIDEKDPDPGMLRWAAVEAVGRGKRLVVVHICEWLEGERPPRPMYRSADRPPGIRVGPERVVGAALDLVRGEFPGLTVTAEIGIGRPTPALLKLSEDAAMVVVGARGVGGFPGLL